MGQTTQQPGGAANQPQSSGTTVTNNGTAGNGNSLNQLLTAGGYPAVNGSTATQIAGNTTQGNTINTNSNDNTYVRNSGMPTDATGIWILTGMAALLLVIIIVSAFK